MHRKPSLESASHLTVKPAIAAGANVFTINQEWEGASSIDVFGANDLRYKGNMSSGSMAQLLISPDGKTAYTVAAYLNRYTYGEADMELRGFYHFFQETPHSLSLTSRDSILILPSDGGDRWINSVNSALADNLPVT
jgi:hypothetical protein